MKNTVAFQRELDLARETFGFDFMALALVESAEHNYVIKWKYASGNKNDRYKRIVLQSGKGIAGMVFKIGKPLLIPSIEQVIGSSSLFNYPIAQSESLKSMGAVPLWNDQRVEGVLLGAFRGENQVTNEQLQAMVELTRTGFRDLNGKEMTTS
ncbi:GAF domain-containing protein [Paenibacillus sp. CAA11]|uniref:GAF domain-containing protein n=1 Tax=Paenibacillus sp. CAA11 TaxID=1532905 RepID=UPI000D3562A6|nr:GAF domain-containing protein [Paenibacillus sp. CAA11]AWB44617.1 GAF domain-containing protein [Paenibacillus sp. CAA11]